MVRAIGVQKGREFNVKMSEKYQYNEIILENGKRLDSYVPRQEIISRKYTQLSEIKESTAKLYLNELVEKYAPETRIAEVTSNKTGNNAGILSFGNELRGQMVLEVPVQNKPVPKSILDYASSKQIIIKDELGNYLN